MANSALIVLFANSWIICYLQIEKQILVECGQI